METDKNLYDAVIVGGGPAGLTAALYLARARYRVLVVEKDRFGGQIATTSEIVNYPGVAIASGSELSECMRGQAESFGAEFLMAEVTSLSVAQDIKVVHTSSGDLRCFGILLAAGASPRQVGFQGESEFRGRGVAYCATCDGEFFTGKEVFVVGGGFAAAEESVFLTRFATHVTILMRSSEFRCAGAVCDKARTHEQISIVPNTVLEEVSGDKALTKVRYRNLVTKEVTERKAPEGDSFGVFVFAGYEPATALVRDMVTLDERNYIVCNQTQNIGIQGVFAAGDVCRKDLRQLVTATGEAALAATEMEPYLSAMQEKTGLMAPIPHANPSLAAKKSAVAVPAAGRQAEGGLFDAATLTQLETVFSRMEQPLMLRLALGDRPVSAELKAYMDELTTLTDKVTLKEVSADEEAGLTPCVRVCHADGSPTGLAFHGVPGGHEFTSFVLGLYNVAGPGQPLDAGIQQAIAALEGPLNFEVLVSLSCTVCPDTVVAVQRVAAENPQVHADIYDISHFPELKDRYDIMSVPCIVLNGGEQMSFGKKSVAQVLELARR